MSHSKLRIIGNQIDSPKVFSGTTIVPFNHPFALPCPYFQTATNPTMASYKKQNKIPLNGTMVNGAHLEKN
ncbi:hypothetical protein CEXT_346021 [Caerostris extrusa]|uniref:Uncharacterized protein n=1 Tax=Caerostris extrusa TaxID=172846 RepID=A0AAV4Q9L0_CAEEX|nr:hypothetical protein CEXT_346021 [Caerostris extrusa]